MSQRYYFERFGYPITQSDVSSKEAMESFHIAARNLIEGTNEVHEPDMGRLLSRALGRRAGDAPECAEDRINDLDRDGWELMQVFVDASGPVAIFRRKSA